METALEIRNRLLKTIIKESMACEAAGPKKVLPKSWRKK